MESRLILQYTKAGATVENINFDAFQKILLPIPPEKQIPLIISAANDAEKVIEGLEKIKKNRRFCFSVFFIRLLYQKNFLLNCIFILDSCMVLM